MKIKSILVAISALSILMSVAIGRATDITATGSGNWSSTVPDAPWPGGIVPGVGDDVDVESPNVITVDTNEVIQFIYGTGSVIMAPNVTLNVVGDTNGADGTQSLTLLDASASGNTVIYSGNPFWAKHQNYYNLVFSNTVAPGQLDFYNGNIGLPGDNAVAMTIAGNMTVIGKIKVQQGDDFIIDGNLTLLTNGTWDCSSYNLTVLGNTTMGGLLLDLDGANGSNYFGGSLTVTSNSLGWNVSDVTNWVLGASLTNNNLIAGTGFGSIYFNGTGFITGSKPITLPTMTVNGTYTIGTTITLITNTPGLNGTLIFDLARTNQMVLLTNAGTALYYSGNLNVINSGATPSAGKSYKLFNAPSYGGAFASTSFPTLPAGLSWTDNTLLNGSITVSGTTALPTLNIANGSGSVVLSWDSATFPGFHLQTKTNGIGNWSNVSGGTTSPFSVPGTARNNQSVFFRLANP
jgi:hypothetical protein